MEWMGGLTVIIMQILVQIGLNRNYQLELKWAIFISVSVLTETGFVGQVWSKSLIFKLLMITHDPTFVRM